MAAQLVVASYRNTLAGSMTVPVGVRRVGSAIAVVPPIRRRYSRSGTHGTHYYIGVDAIVYLDRTSGGHRSAFVRCLTGDVSLCDALRRCAHYLWAARKLSVREVIAALPACRLL